MKKILILFTVACLLLSGCAESQDNVSDSTPTVENTATIEVSNADTPDVEQTAESKTVYPLPDTSMESLSDAILNVSLEEGDVYLDDAGVMQMNIKIYSYDMYDMVDISMLRIGDTLVRHSGEVKLESLVRKDDGSISVNGGLDGGGFDLITDDCGCFFERGYNDAMNWYEVGEASIPVSAEFKYHDSSDLDNGEIIYYPDSFFNGAVSDYHFTPHNTTIRVESGRVVEMNRRYVP